MYSYTCTPVHKYTCTHTHVLIHTHTHVLIHTHTHVLIHTHTHVLIHMHSYKHIHMYSYACTHTPVHTYTMPLSLPPSGLPTLVQRGTASACIPAYPLTAQQPRNTSSNNLYTRRGGAATCISPWSSLEPPWLSNVCSQTTNAWGWGVR
jgi:hypothetical protein